MKTKSDQIRELAKTGMSTADIARQLSIRYQLAYNVLSRSGMQPSRRETMPKQIISKPRLTISYLLERSFQFHGKWGLNEEGELVIAGNVPHEPGCYAFAQSTRVQYVGLASSGLAKRFRSYRKPGKTQNTSIRVNALIKSVLSQGDDVDILCCTPKPFTWRGLPVHLPAGIELGLLRAFDVPWNLRSSR